MTQPKPPPRCRSTFGGMRCQDEAGHTYQNPPTPHRHGEWRWNRKLQWSAPPLPIEAK